MTELDIVLHHHSGVSKIAGIDFVTTFFNRQELLPHSNFVETAMQLK